MDVKCVVFISIFVAFAGSCETELSQREEDQDTFADSSKSLTNFTEIIVDTIKKLEDTAAKTLYRKSILPANEIEILYEEIADALSDLHEIIREPNNAYIFLKSKGVDRVLKPNMDVDYPKLRIIILTILKTLFKIAPVTTDAIIPITTLDVILDIFENDDNLVIKAQTLDILYTWLPNNPRVQVRVMKLKGLEPFYEQLMTKINVTVMSTLLDLFNKILNEHIQVFQDKNGQNSINSDKLLMYKRIGLIERMSTTPVCKGLLNIFKLTWSYNNTQQEVIEPLFGLIKKMKRYCLKVLQGNALAIELFGSILKFVKESEKDFGEVSVAEMQSTLEDYVKELQYLPSKDEF